MWQKAVYYIYFLRNSRRWGTFFHILRFPTLVSEAFLEIFLLLFLRGSLPLSRRKISRKTSGTRVASSIQTLQIFTVKFKSAGASFSVACEQQTYLRSSLLMRLLFAGYFFSTLGARDFSSAVSGFCQVFIVTHAKIPTAREKNLWYPGYFFSQDVKKIKGHLNKRCQCQAKPQFVSEESFSWKLKFAISSKRTFHKHYSEWTSNIKLFHVLKVVAWILVSNKTVSLRTSLRRTLISKS